MYFRRAGRAGCASSPQRRSNRRPSQALLALLQGGAVSWTYRHHADVRVLGEDYLLPAASVGADVRAAARAAWLLTGAIPPAPRPVRPPGAGFQGILARVRARRTRRGGRGVWSLGVQPGLIATLRLGLGETICKVGGGV